jgi:hypothetical protein
MLSGTFDWFHQFTLLSTSFRLTVILLLKVAAKPGNDMLNNLASNGRIIEPGEPCGRQKESAVHTAVSNGLSVSQTLIGTDFIFLVFLHH